MYCIMCIMCLYFTWCQQEKVLKGNENETRKKGPSRKFFFFFFNYHILKNTAKVY